MGEGGRRRPPRLSLRLPFQHPLHVAASGLGAPLDAKGAGSGDISQILKGAHCGVRVGGREDGAAAARNVREFAEALEAALAYQALGLL